jgi:large subunit ribosomal protein L21
VYAIVRAGGRQEKVAVGDLVVVDRVSGAPGASLQFQPLLVVDGQSVTSDAAALADVTVTAEVVGHSRGKKIEILRYKNKSGYRRRQGHRSELTTIKVTGIGTAGSTAAASTAESAPAAASTAESAPAETAPVETAPVETAPAETTTTQTATTTETATTETATPVAATE